MIKIKPGCEGNKFWGLAGSEIIPGKPLKDLSQKQLQSIFDGDPTNARGFLEGEVSTNAPVTDNTPDKPLPVKPVEAPVTMPTATAKAKE